MTDALRSSMRCFGTSIFSSVTALADRHRAVNLAQGFPDFDPPEELVDAARAALAGPFHQYPPSAGLPELRDAIAAHARTRYGLDYDPDRNITVTAGATEGLWSAAMALLEPGDEVILIEPFYELYPACVAAAGAVARFVPTRFPDFRIDLDLLADAFTDRTRLVFVNTPTNPTGRLLRRDELRALGELAERHDAYIVSDETYEHLTFGANAHLPVAAEPRCRDRTLTVSSISKTFSATGWRIGWVMAPTHLTDAVRRVHQFVTFAAPAPLQKGAASMLVAAGHNGYYDQLRARYAERRSTLLRSLERTGLELVRPEGTYFVMTRCPGDDVDYCTDLVTRAGVAAIPASSFYHHRELGRGLVRFAFCKRVETLLAAGERLSSCGTRTES